MSGAVADLGPAGPIAEHDSVYRILVTFAESALFGDRPGDAILWIEVAARYASLHHPGFFRLSDLEGLLATIQDRILPVTEAPPIRRSRVAGPDGKFVSDGPAGETVLHVMTEAHDIGGLTRSVCRWIEGDPRRSTVALTKDGPVPPVLAESVGRAGASVRHLSGFPGDRALELRKLASDFDYVVLTVMAHDAVPFLAFAGQQSPPVILFNQADHAPWLGAPAANVLVNGRTAGLELAVARRYVPRENVALLPSVPTPISGDGGDLVVERRQARTEASVNGGEVVLLTVASGYKYRPVRTVSLPGLLEPVLAAHPSVRLVAIGASSTPEWSTLSERFGDRVLLRPPVRVPDEIYWLADVFLDAIPCGSVVAALDASLRGLPVLALRIDSALGAVGPDEPGWGVTGIDAPGFGEHHFQASSLDEYTTRLTQLIEDADFRHDSGLAGRRDVIDAHTDPAWSQRLDALYEQSRRVGKIPSVPGDPESVDGPLDELLAEMFGEARWDLPLAELIWETYARS